MTKIRVKDENGKEVPDLEPSEIDDNLLAEMKNIDMKYWYPTDKLPLNPSINQKFIDDLGGDDFSYLWTKRNLYILSKMFDLIIKEEPVVVEHLLLAFIHTLHLVCKMVYPRTEKGNRKYSGSWGRADYMIRNNSMEQNPLIVFLRSCFDRQGVVEAMNNAKERLPKDFKANIVDGQHNIKKNANLNYGVMDVADLCDYIEEKSIDFIITDPPYGGYCFKDIYNGITGKPNQVHTRALHAEENAFLQIAKYGGAKIQGGKLFTTASPCELCSKKAYQLGIKEIYYIDPYPGIKSNHCIHGTVLLGVSYLFPTNNKFTLSKNPKRI